MLKEPKEDIEKVKNNGVYQKGTINKEMKNLRRIQKDILELKSTITEMKKSH